MVGFSVTSQVIEATRASLQAAEAEGVGRLEQSIGELAMSLIDQYLRRSQEIIGSRTRSEEQYDNVVITWLKKGLNIKRAIKKANKRYPDEALKVDQTNVDDVAAHYEYLMEHMEIMKRISSEQDQA